MKLQRITDNMLNCNFLLYDCAAYYIFDALIDSVIQKTKIRQFLRGKKEENNPLESWCPEKQ